MKNLVFTLLASLMLTVSAGGCAQAAESDPDGDGSALPLSTMKVRIASGEHVATFQLYDTEAAAAFYAQLPLTLDLENFRDAQWMFYPPEKLPVTAAEAYHDGKKGELSYYAPWGDAFMLYKDFYAGDEMHRLGVNLTGIDAIEGMSGRVTIEPLQKEQQTMTNQSPKTDGTAVTLTVGETRIPAVLNETRTAQALIDKLPYTVTLFKSVHDYCGVMSDAPPYDEQDEQNGWINGDISFETSGNYFAILYKDEQISQQYGNLVPMGRITVPLSVMDTLANEINVRIELDQDNE